MSLTLNAAQLADTGFVLFVVFTCGYSLFGNSSGPSAKSKRWIEELRQLQETLRELIGEATAASSSLDRTLQKRKLELEKLLQRLESATESREITDDYPNETWVNRSRASEAPPQQVRAPAPQRATTPQRGGVQSSQLTQAQLTQALNNRRAQAQAMIDPQESDLARRIEVFLDGKKPLRATSEDGPDPVAYKVARRLLQEGKEIHIVAKKVGLPVEEVRVLDSMLRGIQMEQESAHIVRSTEAPTYSMSKQIINSRDPLSDELEELLLEQERSIELPRGNIRRETTFL